MGEKTTEGRGTGSRSSLGPAAALRPEKACPGQQSFLLDGELSAGPANAGSVVPIPEAVDEVEGDAGMDGEGESSARDTDFLPGASPSLPGVGLRGRVLEIRRAVLDLIDLVERDSNRRSQSDAARGD